MKIKYLKKAPSRAGQIVLLKDLEEGEVALYKYGFRASDKLYYRFHNGYLECAYRKRNPIWNNTDYAERAVKEDKNYLSTRSVEIIK